MLTKLLRKIGWLKRLAYCDYINQHDQMSCKHNNATQTKYLDPNGSPMVKFQCHDCGFQDQFPAAASFLVKRHGDAQDWLNHPSTTAVCPNCSSTIGIIPKDFWENLTDKQKIGECPQCNKHIKSFPIVAATPNLANIFCSCPNPVRVPGIGCPSCWTCKSCGKWGGCSNQI